MVTPKLVTGDMMLTRNWDGHQLVVAWKMNKSFKNSMKLISSLRPKIKNIAWLSTAIQLGMVIWAEIKGLFPKDKSEWVQWMYDNIWSHAGMYFDSLPQEEQLVRIKESVRQGYRRRVFDEHYEWDHNKVRFVRLIPNLTEKQKRDLVYISDWQIEHNKGYQYPSILAFIPYILTGGCIKLFIPSKGFTICFESTYRNFKYILPFTFKNNPEYVTIFELYIQTIMKVTF
jgi:hypothetical protein